MLLRSLIVFLLVLVSVESLKILGVFAHPGRTHFEVFRPLLEALTQRGHELTVIGYFPSQKKLPRYNDLVLKYPGDELKHTLKMEDITGARSEKYFGAAFIRQFGKLSCELSLPSKQYHDLLNTNEKFDIIIAEYFNSNCLLTPLIEKFKIPFIGITSHVLMPWAGPWAGNPDNPGYVPVLFMDNSYEMSFLQRVENTVMNLFNKFYYRYIIEDDEFEMVKKYVGNEFSHGKDVMYNTSLILSYTHFSLHGARPFVPNVIEVAGLHLEEHKKLPPPILRDQNKQARLQFCLSMVKPNGYFEDQYQYVHIDEKWFYLTKEKRSCYVTLDEDLPQRACKNKQLITKVMFMAAVARPRYDAAKTNTTLTEK
ncbi:hypothetical protein ILUMI_24652 [Ignelater luminosus]|uniref:Uncharacterized protein n=1 Tax=Ignelater luminosus TaxID=2038154 RepID=A0A8K0G0P2_IGNLU|nr:hypothetical protein ILUMI_24652 [Ignelater luminosus]